MVVTGFCSRTDISENIEKHKILSVMGMNTLSSAGDWSHMLREG